MQLTLGAKLGGGGFADVYEATDNLGRRVAVKIIRASAGQYSDAMAHARALARARHPNVVEILSLERITDPETGQDCDAVVMELLEGETLSARLNTRRFSRAEVTRFGRGMIAGITHIHQQGLAHGDLHEDNVLLVGMEPKIIDILYRDSLALLSTASQQGRLKRDLLNLRMILYDALLKSELDVAEATDFNATLGSDPSLSSMSAAFETVIDPARADNIGLKLDHALKRIRDPGFVEGPDYAAALAQETPLEVTAPLLHTLATDGGNTKKQKAFIALMWKRLTPGEKDSVARELGQALDTEVPKGQWYPRLQMLAALGRDGWDRLATTTRLRLENAMTTDILAGHRDIYRPTVGGSGALGTHVNTFWSYFRDRDRLVDNIAARLATNWYGQNYVGNFFLWLLPRLGDTPARRERLISGLVSAIKNDAREVLSNIRELPPDWRAELRQLVDGVDIPLD